ncbi:hypothetical protein [Sulfuracidifex tepidarius]|uniref:hypothetical protein n=1 Tax=Sulfuracidifex tepidarius TaxID=1294262 RepID=UPI000A3DDFC5|nr:hypothetical protein [Sulfuracidifex tepidarius]
MVHFLIYSLFLIPLLGGALSLKWKFSSVISSLVNVVVATLIFFYPPTVGLSSLMMSLRYS